MTETNPRPQPVPHPRLASPRMDGPPAFLADGADGVILEANAAATQIGLAGGTQLPEGLVDLLRTTFQRTPHGSCLARLRPSRRGTAQTFRCTREEDGVLFFAAPTPQAGPAPAAAPARVSAPPRSEEASAPLRFNFETDAEGRLLWLSPALANALGAGAARLLGATFAQLEAAGLLRGSAEAQTALAGDKTFSNMRVSITDDAPVDLPFDLEIGGVPLLGADRARAGVKGFGVAWPRPRPPSPGVSDARPLPVGPPSPRRLDPDDGMDAKVVPLRGAAPLTASERSAFREIARTLSAAVEGWQKAPASDGATGALAEPSPFPLPVSGEIRLHPGETLPDDGPEEHGAPGPDLLDRLPVAVLVQQNGEVVHANRTFHHWTGYEDLEAFAHAGGLAGALERDETGQLQLLAASGSRLPVEVRLLVAPFRGRNALIYAVRRLDVPPSPSTENLRQQERARARRDALHLVPWPVLLLEADGLVLFANAAATRILEMDEQSLEGAPFVQALDENDHPAAWAALDEAMEAQPTHLVSRSLRLRTASGETVPVRAAFGPGGPEDRLVCLILNPEPAPPSAEQAGHTEEELPTPSGDQDLSAPGSEPSAETEREIAYLSRLAQLMSDRLAGPLTLLLAESPSQTDAAHSAEARAALAQIRDELDDLATLAGSAPATEAQNCDLAAVAQAALDHLAPSARRRGVRLRADLPAAAAVAAAEPHLARLVRLILEDAIAASPAGASVGVSLDVEEDGTRVLAVADGGAARDEVAMAQARDPLREQAAPPAARGDRLLRLARLEQEATDLGGAFGLQRGLPQGQIARLRLPPAGNS